MFRLYLPLLLAALADPPAFAQDGTNTPPPASPAAFDSASRALTLADAIALAFNAHPDLAAARHEAGAVEAARTQAGASPNPTVGIEMQDTRRETRTTTLLVSQQLELGGKRAARIEVADRARDVAALQLDARKAEIRAAVSAAYAATLIAEERVRLAEASLALARSAREAAAKRVTAGKVSPIEATRARVAESGVALELGQARSELQTSLNTLRTAIGHHGIPVERLDGSAETLPPVLSLEGLEQRLASAPALREAAGEVRRLGALARLEQTRRTPDVTVSIGAARSPDAPGRNQAVFGVSVPLPFFDTHRGNVHEALRREDKARDEARSLELRLRSEALAAQQRLLTATTAVETLRRDVLPDARSAFEATTKGFELGKFSFLETLDAQRTLFQARAHYLSALSEAHRAASDLERLLGEPAATAVNAVSETAEGVPQ